MRLVIQRWWPVVVVAGILLASSTMEWPARLPFTTCIFRNVTGLPCPGCGMTRGFVAMGHGRLAGAWAFNKISPGLYAFAWCFLAGAVACRVRPSLSRLKVPRRLQHIAYAVVLVLVMAAWIAHFT